MSYRAEWQNNLSTTEHAAGDRRQSPSIWADCPQAEMLIDPGVGILFFDDFLSSYDLATNQTTVTKLGPYEAYTGNGTNLLVSGGVTGIGGTLVIASGDTADINAVFTLGGGAPFMISTTDGDDCDLWFECRFKISSITTADQAQVFIGLTEEDRAAANGIWADAGGDLGFTTTIDLLGFARSDNDGASVSLAYQKASQTPQDNNQAAIVADTFLKLGFKYKPKGDASKRIRTFKNAVEQTTYVTSTNLAAATFPNGEELTLCLAVQNDSTTTNSVTLDWWKCAQLSEVST